MTLPPQQTDPAFFDLGHRGDVDYTLLDLMLVLSPTERLDKHEEWRLFVKEALRHAELRQDDDGLPGGGHLRTTTA